jgi:hypothetical protein
LAPGACAGIRPSQIAGQCPRNARLSRPGGRSIRLAHRNPAGVGERRARSRAPDTLVEATFHAIADAGSIPAVSTSVGRQQSKRLVARSDERAEMPLVERQDVEDVESFGEDHYGGVR